MKFSPTLTLQYDTAFSPFTAAEFDEGLQWAKASGFDGVEICISNYNGIDIPALKAKLDALELGVSTLSTGQARTLEKIALLSDPVSVRRTQQRFYEHIDAAAVLGSKVTMGLLRGLGVPENQEGQKKLLAEQMKPIVEYADKKGVTIIFEGINRYETALLCSAAEAAEFVRVYLGNPDCVGVLWDVFHANIEDPSMEAAIEAIGDKLKHVHFADSNRWFPGYGHIDFEGVCRMLKARGYSEYCSFECNNLPSVEVVRNNAGPFIQRLRKV